MQSEVQVFRLKTLDTVRKSIRLLCLDGDSPPLKDMNSSESIFVLLVVVSMLGVGAYGADAKTILLRQLDFALGVAKSELRDK